MDLWTQWEKERVGQTEKLALAYLQCLHECVLGSVRLFATQWTVAFQASLSMGFSRQEYWSGLLFPPLEGLPNPGIEPLSLMPPELVGKCFSTSATCGKGRPLHFTFTKHFHIYYLMWAAITVSIFHSSC